jgi:hypothetical protein
MESNIKMEIRHFGNSDKEMHQLTFLSGMPGIGKTRMLLENINLDVHVQNRLVVKLYCTYNSGFYPRAKELSLSAEAALAWRILYFFFIDTLKMPLDDFFEHHATCDLSLKCALQCIALHTDSLTLVDNRVGATNEQWSHVHLVFILCIDELQDAAKHVQMRLDDVLTALCGVVEYPLRTIAVIPLLAGILNNDLRTAARASRILPGLVPLAPLTFEDAVAIVTSLQCQKHLRTWRTRARVFALASVPRGLLAYCNYLNSDLSAIDDSSNYLPEITNLNERILARHLLALSLCESVVMNAGDKVDVEHGMGIGACFQSSVEAGAVRITVPYCVVEALAKDGRSDAHDGLTSAVLAVTGYLCGSEQPWDLLEKVVAAFLSLRFNAHSHRRLPNVSLKQLLKGAVFSDEVSANLSLPIRQGLPVLQLGHEIDPKNGLGQDMSVDGRIVKGFYWLTQDASYICYANQPIVDSLTIIQRPTLVSDVAIIVQDKLRRSAGLQPATYKKMAPWVKDFQSAYTRVTGRDLFVVFGVVDPLKEVSQPVMVALAAETDLDNGLVAFALGRQGCKEFLAFLADHPLVVPRIFINDSMIESGVLALGLPFAQSTAQKHAKTLLEHRNGMWLSGHSEFIFRDWDHLREILGMTAEGLPETELINFS